MHKGATNGNGLELDLDPHSGARPALELKLVLDHLLARVGLLLLFLKQGATLGLRHVLEKLVFVLIISGSNTRINQQTVPIGGGGREAGSGDQGRGVGGAHERASRRCIARTPMT